MIILQGGRLLAQGAALELLVQPQVHQELGAAPFVAEVNRALALTGTGVYDNGYLPRTGTALVRALLNQCRRENDQ